MDTGRIKQFATESRRILKEGVMQRIRAIGFDSEGNTPDLPERVQGGTRYQGRLIENERFYDCWMALNKRIHELGKNGVQMVYEEAAYTWFNRLVAIRIMQKNDFIEPVLSYDVADIRVPHIVSEARKGRMMVKLTEEEDRRLRMLLMDDTKTQEQFALLITAYCRENAVISKCFGGIDLYLELLLPDDILSANRFIDLLNHTNEYITEEQFHSAELIGWLYQFYISERKDEVFASFKKGKKAEAEDIPAATQIFTPNWIVKYMVQNTVGRIYLDNNAYCPLKKDWRYLVEPAEPTPKEAILKVDDLEELTLADLACGSGHILVEGFDLFYSLYIDEGYSRHDAVEKILTKNLTGIDLDTRAKQLATFALLLKAAQIDETFLDGKVMPRVLDMPKVDRYTWRDLDGHMCCALQMDGPSETVFKELDEAFDLMKDAQNLGSIMKFNVSEETREFMLKCIEKQNSLHQFEESFAELFHGFEVILALTEKYATMVMNPPYMGSGNMNDTLSTYVKENYEEGKSDLFSTFMILAINRLMVYGKYGMINMHSWMFLSSFERLRRTLLDSQSIDNLLHLGPRTFDELSGEVVQNTAFIITKIPESLDTHRLKKGTYYRLVDGRNCADKEKLFLQAKDIKGVYFPKFVQKDFDRIPGSPLGFWVTDKVAKAFRETLLDTIAKIVIGIKSGDNDVFIKQWTEISSKDIGFGCKDLEAINSSSSKWFPYVKGGEFRKWYGNQELVINWEDNGQNMLNHINKSGVRDARIRQSNFGLYGHEFLTWSRISSDKFGIRYVPEGVLFDCNSPSVFEIKESLSYILGLLASKVTKSMLEIIAPTLSFQIQDVKAIPFIKTENINIDAIVHQNISISKSDWDAHETSWDFEANELLRITEQEYIDIYDDYADFHGLCIDLAAPELNSLEWRYNVYKTKWTTNFMRLHQNEEELNRQFISIYGLEDELTPDVPLDEITILQQGEVGIENNDLTFHADVVMKQLISYAIG